MAIHKRGPIKPDILAPLKAAEIIAPKAVLPAEIVATILDYLPIPELLRFARVSKRYQEMVYDESRWVKRLILMGCWDEAEARKRSEEAARRRLQVTPPRHAQGSRSPARSSGTIHGNTAGKGGPGRPGPSMFNPDVEGRTQEKSATRSTSEWVQVSTDGHGHQNGSISHSSMAESSSTGQASASALSALHILSTIRSIRSLARHEYGRVYRVLAPYYLDLAGSTSHAEASVFRTYRAPSEQAQMLAQVSAFAKSDITPGGHYREEKVTSTIGVFEAAALREFEHGLEIGDVDGRMRQYAQVLVTLNGGQSCLDLFVRRHPILRSKDRFGNPMDCIVEPTAGAISLSPAYSFFQQLSTTINEQSSVIDRVFAPSLNVFIPLFERIAEDVVSEYVTTLFDEVHRLSVESYIKALPGVYEQARAFVRSIRPPKGKWEQSHGELLAIVSRIFEPHIDLYLREELDHFQQKSMAEVEDWEQKLSEQDASTESFLMSNINRQVAKKDFLSSFKKVVMMPVNILPVFPLSSQASANKPASTSNARPLTPSVDNSRAPSPARPMSLAEAPTTELAAKAAIMNSRLEGIRSLFSIEVALNIVHTAKASLERVAVFATLGGSYGEAARGQCQAIFITLLQVLGTKHVKAGFDRAVEHLSKYNPREVTEHRQAQVTPLVTFLELVNVGDLIQQMVDVFFEQELVAAKLVDRNDFLDSASKEKKRFEQMLDERVAAGLNKGIDVLMDEVEHLFATTQQPTDYNPVMPENGSSMQEIDVGPTRAAKEVVEVVSSHTKMLVGSTDKTLLDVFNQEVGLRLFTALCKHIKRQRISIDGSIRLISDTIHYYLYIQTLKNNDLMQYFKALREVSQIYLVDGSSHAKELATMIADGDRFHGVFGAEEVYEFAERRADWYTVKKSVERGLYGVGCGVM